MARIILRNHAGICKIEIFLDAQNDLLRGGACSAFCSADFCSLLEMILRNLQVMFRRNLSTVPKPCADNVGRKVIGKFRLPCRAQVVEELGPGHETRRLDNSKQTRT